MKHLLFLSLFLSLCSIIAEAQTNANIPSPENVLVVYNSSDTTSLLVANYYKNERDIPSVNIVGLYLPDTSLTINSITHRVIIAQETDIIRDSVNHAIGTWYATEHAWKYFYRYVALPIKNHLTSNNLTSIRYIVLCKGVPFKVQAGADSSSVICNLTVDGLLCMLNTNNYEAFLHDLYNEFRSYAISANNYCYGCQLQILNPYYNVDPNYTMNYRFASNFFTRSWGSYTVKLDYLVSHLDGTSYDIVEGMIDRSVNADKSGSATWVLDDDPYPNNFAHTWFTDAKDKLENLGFNVEYDYTNNWVTSYQGNVMGYSSYGTHAEDYNCNFQDSAWVKDSLQFVLANGAIFNVLESFNGQSLTTLNWRFNEQGDCSGHTMGLATQFTEIGGTGMMAHGWEPYFYYWGGWYPVIDNKKTFPAYAMGYNLVDAIYQGMNALAWVNVVVGDPLTTIAWGKQTLTEDVTMSNTNLVTGEVTVPLANTITLDANAVLRFKHNGFITGDGSIITDGKNFEFQIEDWDRAVFRSSEDNHPKLIWGEYPVASPTVVGYNIYRKWEQNYFSLIGSTDEETFYFIDEDVEIYIPSGEDPKNSEYYVKAILYVGPGTEESDPSNTIDYWVNKVGKIKSGAMVEEFVYELEQNYPNPFNPVTTINYQIQKDGFVTLKVFDILGKEVANLVNENKVAGNYSINFNASKLSSGLYIYQLKTTGFTQTRKMILTK